MRSRVSFGVSGQNAVHPMYQCQICGSTVPSKTPAQRLTLETRVRHYPERPAVHLVPKHKKKHPKRKQAEYADDPGGIGLEIVREALVCSRCAAHGR